MSPVNGHANSAASVNAGVGLDTVVPGSPPANPQFSLEQIATLVTGLELPFEPKSIEWRVTNTSKNGKPRGQVIPYADQRAYTDRLNMLFSPAGWTREYVVHTSATFQRGKDHQTVAKVFVTCKVTIFGLNSHSATGEEWADDDNAATAAEAQAFKRACSCFGLGRYLYYFEGEWVDLDERKRPKNVPKLPKWATPEGWRQGLRPQQANGSAALCTGKADGHHAQASGHDDASGLIRQIESLEEPLGKGIYRGLLKTVARAWKPNQIQEHELLEKLLTHMRAAQRGLLRLDAALNVVGPQALQPVLRSLNLRSLDNVDNLDTLKQIVLAVEEAAAKAAK